MRIFFLSNVPQNKNFPFNVLHFVLVRMVFFASLHLQFLFYYFVTNFPHRKHNCNMREERKIFFATKITKDRDLVKMVSSSRELVRSKLALLPEQKWIAFPQDMIKMCSHRPRCINTNTNKGILSARGGGALFCSVLLCSKTMIKVKNSIFSHFIFQLMEITSSLVNLLDLFIQRTVMRVFGF